MKGADSSLFRLIPSLSAHSKVLLSYAVFQLQESSKAHTLCSLL